MEDALVLLHKPHPLTTKTRGLNPCFNGRCTSTHFINPFNYYNYGKS